MFSLVDLLIWWFLGGLSGWALGWWSHQRTVRDTLKLHDYILHKLTLLNMKGQIDNDTIEEIMR